MRLLSVAVVLASLFLSACSEDEDIYEPDPLIEIDNQFETRTLWSTSVGDGIGESYASNAPVFAYDKIFVADTQGTVAAVNPNNGKKVWEKEFELPISAGPAVGQKLLAFGTSQGDLLVIDAESGEEKWRVQLTSEVVSSPAIGEGIVAVRTVDGKIYAYDAQTGKEKWFYDEALPALTLRGNSSPIIAGGGVISGFSNGKLAVFIADTGQLAWEKRIATPIGSSEIQRLVDVDLKPLVVGSSIYIGSFNGNLASLNVRNGEINWQRELSTFQDMAVSDLLLFVTHENSYVSGLNRTNGVILWTQKDLNRRKLTAPVAVNDYVVVFDFEGYMHWISHKNGKIVSREHIDSSGIGSKPLVIDDKIIVYTRDGDLVALAKK